MVSGQQHLYAVFRRHIEGYWQSIAGGGEGDETPLEAVQRETFEEAAVPFDSQWITLQTRTSVPITYFRQHEHWDTAILVIPVHYFGVIISTDTIVLSPEHSEYQWMTETEAQTLLKWDSDRTALWELDQLLRRQSEKPV